MGKCVHFEKRHHYKMVYIMIHFNSNLYEWRRWWGNYCRFPPPNFFSNRKKTNLPFILTPPLKEDKLNEMLLTALFFNCWLSRNYWIGPFCLSQFVNFHSTISPISSCFSPSSETVKMFPLAGNKTLNLSWLACLLNVGRKVLDNYFCLSNKDSDFISRNIRHSALNKSEQWMVF